MEEESQQSIWNFDGAELYMIFQIKSAVVQALEKWDIPDAYKKVRLMRMEIDSKLSRGNKKILEEFQESMEDKSKSGKKATEKEEIDGLLKELDGAYSIYAKDNYHDEDEKSAIYQSIESFYMHLCYIMKKHGLYFREGEDMRLAVLKR